MTFSSNNHNKCVGLCVFKIAILVVGNTLNKTKQDELPSSASQFVEGTNNGFTSSVRVLAWHSFQCLFSIDQENPCRMKTGQYSVLLADYDVGSEVLGNDSSGLML